MDETYVQVYIKLNNKSDDVYNVYKVNRGKTHVGVVK